MRHYPVYSPPFHGSELVLAKREIKANFDYFLEQKAARLEYLAKYMAQFSVDLRLEPDTLSALDGWLYRYGGHLIPSGGEVIGALADYEPAMDSRLTRREVLARAACAAAAAALPVAIIPSPIGPITPSLAIWKSSSGSCPSCRSRKCA